MGKAGGEFGVSRILGGDGRDVQEGELEVAGGRTGAGTGNNIEGDGVIHGIQVL